MLFVNRLIATVALIAFMPLSAFAADAIAHVEKRGEGPISMILIPGSPCDWRVWEEFMERNEERYTMYAFTLAGFSGTEPLPMPEETDASPTPWFDAAVEAVAEFIQEEELEDVIVVGHSLGGHIALRLALEHPNAAAKIIDIDGVPSSEFGGADLTPQERAAEVEAKLGPQFRNMSDDQAAGMLEQTARLTVTDRQRADELTEMFLSTKTPVAVEYLIQGLKSDISDQLKNITTPTLVIAATGQGGADAAARADIREYWEKWLDGAEAFTLLTFDDSRHFVMDDQPQKLDEAIAEFVAPKEPADKTEEEAKADDEEETPEPK